MLTTVVTFGFYFILDHFDTANMIPSTLSVTTSFIAVYLTFRRSPYFALAYAANDVVLIVLWILAAVEDINSRLRGMFTLNEDGDLFPLLSEDEIRQRYSLYLKEKGIR